MDGRSELGRLEARERLHRPRRESAPGRRLAAPASPTARTDVQRRRYPRAAPRPRLLKRFPVRPSRGRWPRDGRRLHGEALDEARGASSAARDRQVGSAQASSMARTGRRLRAAPAGAQRLQKIAEPASRARRRSRTRACAPAARSAGPRASPPSPSRGIHDLDYGRRGSTRHEVREAPRADHHTRPEGIGGRPAGVDGNHHLLGLQPSRTAVSSSASIEVPSTSVWQASRSRP